MRYLTYVSLSDLLTLAAALPSTFVSKLVWRRIKVSTSSLGDRLDY